MKVHLLVFWFSLGLLPKLFISITSSLYSIKRPFHLSYKSISILSFDYQENNRLPDWIDSQFGLNSLWYNIYLHIHILKNKYANVDTY